MNKDQQDKAATTPKTGANQEPEATQPRVLHMELAEHDLLLRVGVSLVGRKIKVFDMKAAVVVPMGMHPGFKKEMDAMFLQLLELIMLKPVMFAYREFFKNHPELWQPDGEIPPAEVEIQTPFGTVRRPLHAAAEPASGPQENQGSTPKPPVAPAN